MKFLRFSLINVLMCVITTVLYAQDAPEVIGNFKDWTSLKNTENNKKTCFIETKPKTSLGNTHRGTPVIYISHMPFSKIRGEVSINAGALIDTSKKVVVSIDNKWNYELEPYEGWAWFKNRINESRIVQSMRSGYKMTVTTHYETGEKVTDSYSLMGISDALASITNECY